MRKIILILNTIASLTSCLFAQLPGDLDASFDTDGILTTDIGEGDDQVWAVALQSNGKIIIAGISSKVSDHDFTVARFNSDGSRDTSFGEDGIQTISFGLGAENATCLTIQQDGKIVVAGYSDNSPHTDFLLARFNEDGSLDSSFGIDGKLTTTFITGIPAFVRSVALQSDGKILVAGWVNAISGNDFALARYNTDGSLDPSFDIDGKLTTNFGGSDLAISLVVQADGRFVVGGRSFNDFALARYNLNGTLDSSFSNDGKLTTDIGGSDQISSLAIQPDGRIVACGYTDADSATNFALTRYFSDGDLDSNFGNNGIVITDFGKDDLAGSVAIQPDGKIIAAGYSLEFYNPTPYGYADFALVRYDNDGVLDNTFGIDGKITTDFGARDQARSVILQPDGKIIAAGLSRNFFNTPEDEDADFALARYNAIGTLDTSFGYNGSLIASSILGGNDIIQSLAIQSDGMIVTAGNTTKKKWDEQYKENFYFTNFALARYNSAGALDITFAQKGIQTTAIGDHGGNEDYAYSIAIQQDGKIIAAGYSYNRIDKDLADKDFALVRYDTIGTINNSFGALDRSFSGDGKLITDFGGDEIVNAVAIQPDGKIVGAGHSIDGTYKRRRLALARYNQNGTLDNSFGSEGILTDSFSQFDDLATSAIIQPDKKILLAGYTSGYTFADDSFSHFLLARFNADGALDKSFGSNGYSTTIFHTTGIILDYAYAAVLQPDGKIILSGASFNGENNDFALVRYDANGIVDESFGLNGKVITDFGSGDDVSYSIALQTDGKIVTAGFSENNSNKDFAVVRYNEDGTLDNNFGLNGKLTTPIGAGDDVARSVALQPNGDIVAGGYSYNGSDNDFAVVRYISGLNVGVIDFTNPDNSVWVYPNPIQQNSTLEYTLKNNEEVSIHLLDLHGEIIKTFIAGITKEMGKHQQEINLPDYLPVGCFLIRLSTSTGTKSLKIFR